MKKIVVMFLLCLWAGMGWSQKTGYRLVDQQATKPTKALFANLHRLAASHILFGHQHATEYGHGWQGDANRSDVRSVTGSHPAVIGIDFSGLSGRPDSLVQKEKALLAGYIAGTYNRGGVTTVSWHCNNPVSNTNFYWNDSTAVAAVPRIIPGGSHHEAYKQILRTIAGLANTVRGKDGHLVPVIFRPFHEFDGDWFWWGRAHCTVGEFKTLWRFTVAYLRDSLRVHNFIYAFSPDNKFRTEAEFLERYPGDEWVDMVGMDNYGDFGRDGKYNLEAGFQKLKIVDRYARKAGKLAAFTETGLESIPDTTWWTGKLLATLQREKLRLCYVLVWRNDRRSPTHYYAPFPGHPSEKDFIRFYNHPYTLFEKDLPKIYRP